MSSSTTAPDVAFMRAAHRLLAAPSRVFGIVPIGRFRHGWSCALALASAIKRLRGGEVAAVPPWQAWGGGDEAGESSPGSQAPPPWIPTLPRISESWEAVRTLHDLVPVWRGRCDHVLCDLSNLHPTELLDLDVIQRFVVIARTGRVRRGQVEAICRLLPAGRQGGVLLAG
jgi:hypothetical protein